uniref:ER membrane protein complex subunit 7 beta-sandwich domain-containing protein n=1 Tax=Timema monikensis TaxID=170555 RepID=A0A7R9DZ16_9NEOP|nr:unnamed protein product [Timema monikensis]
MTAFVFRCGWAEAQDELKKLDFFPTYFGGFMVKVIPFAINRIADDKEDGTFTVNNVPSGSYVVEISNPNYAYEPVRVEINSKGKYRARKVNYIQPSQVTHVTYPLKFKPLTRLRYFQVREQWRVTDFLFSPMVLMMVLPLLLIMVLPKMMSDPETRKEMEQLNTNFNYQVPEISEVLTSLFAGGDKQKTKAIKPSKKRQ